IAPTINDGSRESNSTYSSNYSPTTLAPVWTITTSGPSIGGLLSNPPHSVVLAGANGLSGLFADGSSPSPNATTATSYNLPAVTWHWTDNAGGTGIDPADCTTTSSSSSEGSALSLTATLQGSGWEHRHRVLHGQS